MTSNPIKKAFPLPALFGRSLATFPSGKSPGSGGVWPGRSIALRLLTAAGLAGLACGAVQADDSPGVVAVYSKISPSYTRARLPDGKYKAETYSFGEGGRLEGTGKDFTIDQLSFLDVARLIAPALAGQNYWPAHSRDSDQTDLLIMVYWGTTVGTDNTSGGAEYQMAQAFNPPPRPPPPPPPTGLGGTAMASDPSSSGAAQIAAQNAVIKAADDSAQQQSVLMSSMANRQRDRQDVQNASILGYLPELERVQVFQMTALSQQRQDVIDEVEEGRYYVVLLAYDFQTLAKHKQRKLLWETRFSVPERHNDFGKQLAGMAKSASRYFGQDTDGLLRKALPATDVRLGELKVLGVEPEPKK